MLLLPLLLYPLLIIGLLRLSIVQEKKLARKTYRLSILGPPERSSLRKAIEEEEHFEVVTSRKPEEDLKSGKIQLLISAPSNLDALLEKGEQAKIVVSFDGGSDLSRSALARLEERLKGWGKGLLEERLEKRGIPREYIEPLVLERKNIAPPQRVGAFFIGKALAFLLVIMALLGAFYPAVDVVAGEKERGTLETLLSSPAGRFEIVLAKVLAVSVASLATAVANLFSMGVTLFAVKHLILASLPAGAKLPIEFGISTSAILLGIPVLVALAFFFSAVCVVASTLARSAKEAQYYLSPIVLAVIPLSLAGMVPDVSLSARLALVPVVGPTLLFKEMLLGEFNLAGILVTFGSTFAWGFLATLVASRLFETEGALFREAISFSSRALPGERLPTTGEALWIYLSVMVLWFFIGQPFVVRFPVGGTLGAQYLLILGPALAVAFVFRLDIKKVFALKGVSIKVLILSVLIGISAGVLVSQGSATLRQISGAGELAPQAQETYSQFVKGLNLPLALLIVALSAAISEELLFRGFILSGFRRSMTVPAAIVAAGVLFGLMHFNEILAVTILGILFGWLLCRTGSIFPAIVAHASNNALGVFLLKLKSLEPLREARFLPWHLTIAAAVVFLVSLLILAVKEPPGGKKA